VIRESDKDGAVTVCGGGSRARTVYVSKLNHVELQMITDVNSIANNYVFLFLYEGSRPGDVRLFDDSDLANAILLVSLSVSYLAKFHYAILLTNQLESWFTSWFATC